MATPLTLVLGGTGKTGRRVAQRLAARGLPVRVGSRTGHPPFDWEDRRTWEPALHGVAHAYVSYQPDLAVPGANATVGAFAALAARSGVQRLVLLSGRGEESAQRAEQAVQDSGTAWTILQSTWFSQNFSEGSFLPLVRSGEVALPAGDVPEPFVDVDDIADVAVAALTQQGHAGQVYELTGPRLLTFAQAVQEIAQAAGRTVGYVPVAMSRFAAALAEQGEPAEVVALLPRSRPTTTTPPTSRVSRPRWWPCWPTSSARSWMAATPTWPTACSAPWAGRRATLATMSVRLRKPGYGAASRSTGPWSQRLQAKRSDQSNHRCAGKSGALPRSPCRHARVHKDH